MGSVTIRIAILPHNENNRAQLWVLAAGETPQTYKPGSGSAVWYSGYG